MKLVAIGVTFDGEAQSPEQKLEPGEHIVKRVVALSSLYDVLKGMTSFVRLKRYSPSFVMVKITRERYNESLVFL